MTDPSGAMPDKITIFRVDIPNVGKMLTFVDPLYGEYEKAEYRRVDAPAPDTLSKVREIITAEAARFARHDNRDGWNRMSDALALLDGSYPVPEDNTKDDAYKRGWGDALKTWYAIGAKSSVPEGYVLVKREPTEGMKREGRLMLPATKQFDDVDFPSHVFKAMCAASPGIEKGRG